MKDNLKKLELSEDFIKEIIIHLLGSGSERMPKLSELILEQLVEQKSSDELLDYARDLYNEQN